MQWDFAVRIGGDRDVGAVGSAERVAADARWRLIQYAGGILESCSVAPLLHHATHCLLHKTCGHAATLAFHCLESHLYCPRLFAMEKEV